MLAVDDLEAYWEHLAAAIDQAGPERDRLMLAKLALLLGEELGDATRLTELLAIACTDLT